MSRWWPIVLALTLSACPEGRWARGYPHWTLDGGRDLRAGCAIADAFVRRSAKEGIGVTVRVRSTHDCDVRITKAALVFADGARADGVVPAEQAPLTGRSLVYRWIPIHFDGDAAWNAGRVTAALELELTAGGAAKTWRIPATDRFDAPWIDTWGDAR